MKFYVLTSVLMCLYVDVGECFWLEKLIDNFTTGKYYTVIVPRRKRDTQETPWAITNHGVALGQKGLLWNNGNHKLEATLLAGRNWLAKDLKPSQYTARLDYSNDNIGSGGFVQADKVGSSVNLDFGYKYTLYQNSLFSVDLNGYFKQYLSGLHNNGKPHYGTFLNINFPIFGEK